MTIQELLLKNLLLKYGSHLTVSCEYVQPSLSGAEESTTTCRGQSRDSKGCPSNLVESRAESHGYGQKGVVNGIAHLILIINQLRRQKGKLLVVNCTEGSARKLVGREGSSWTQSNRFLFHMEGGWINGSCSNWSHLCKVAWNSPRVSYCDPLGRTRGRLERWVTEAESVYRGLYLRSKNSPAHSRGQHKLAYKRKADCIFLINPTPSAIKECLALNIPLCLLSTRFSFKAAHCHLESNPESYFLIYLINCIINYYK